MPNWLKQPQRFLVDVRATDKDDATTLKLRSVGGRTIIRADSALASRDAARTLALSNGGERSPRFGPRDQEAGEALSGGVEMDVVRKE